jgi:hypothetical protein
MYAPASRSSRRLLAVVAFFVLAAIALPQTGHAQQKTLRL